MRSIRTVAITALLIFSPIWAHAEKATFAGGCFWCVEAAFQDLPGVSSAVSGFTGGKLKNPTYSGNHRGHYEAVEIEYDPEICLLYTSPSPRDQRGSRMPSSA